MQAKKRTKSRPLLQFAKKRRSGYKELKMDSVVIYPLLTRKVKQDLGSLRQDYLMYLIEFNGGKSSFKGKNRILSFLVKSSFPQKPEIIEKNWFLP